MLCSIPFMPCAGCRNFVSKTLAFPVHEVFASPENVRRWIYRLLCKKKQSVIHNRDFLVEAIRSERNNAAREGIALGLRVIWFDGLEEIVLDWYCNEADLKCRAALLEHMAVNSDHVQSYVEQVTRAFEEAKFDQVLRSRLVNAAARTSVYGELRRIMLLEEAQLNMDLFGQKSAGGLFIMGGNNQVFNNSSDIQIGVNAVGGDATSFSDINQVMEIDAATGHLLEKLANIVVEGKSNEQSVAVLSALKELRENPTHSKGKVLLERVKTWTALGALSAEALSNVQPIVEALHKVFAV